MGHNIIGRVVLVIPKLGYILYHIRANLAAIVLATLGLAPILLYAERAYKSIPAKGNS